MSCPATFALPIASLTPPFTWSFLLPLNPRSPGGLSPTASLVPPRRVRTESHADVNIYGLQLNIVSRSRLRVNRMKSGGVALVFVLALVAVLSSLAGVAAAL